MKIGWRILIVTVVHLVVTIGCLTVAVSEFIPDLNFAQDFEPEPELISIPFSLAWPIALLGIILSFPLGCMSFLVMVESQAMGYAAFALNSILWGIVIGDYWHRVVEG
jgi:hypothetical protein